MKNQCGFLPRLREGLFGRVMVGTVVMAMLLLVTEPLAAALNNPGAPDSHFPDGKAAPGQALSQRLREARDLLEAADTGLRVGRSIADERQGLVTLRQTLRELDAGVRADFLALEMHLQSRQVPERIMQRHRNTVAFYEQEMGGLLAEMVALDAVEDESDLADPIHRMRQRLDERRMASSPHPFDPAVLPHEAQQPRGDNLPRLDRDGFVQAGLIDTPLLQLAALEGFRFDRLPGADNPAYVAETTEVTISPAVRKQAEELGHDAAGIYHWVRNHIEWLPTWGAVQDADLTLSARRGNAMDIASLLLALLRASGIPSRYLHGSIEVPEAAFRNWAGGFERIEEAMNYAASGGIPVTGVIQGGRVTHVRMEHVWVEAAVDFLPSRGAVMREADTWLPLDASFKQYEFFQGLDIRAMTGIDGAQLLQRLLDGGEGDAGEGWVQGLDAAVLVDAHQEAEQRLEAFLAQMDAPVVGDVIGGRKVVRREAPVLPSGLPFQRVLEGARYASLPTALQPMISFGLGTDSFGQAVRTASFPWAALNNRKVTLSFRPATDDDEAALEALLPQAGLSDASQLPSSIPAYLIEVTPELRIDGALAATGVPMPLGEELAFTFSVKDPVHGIRHYPNQVVAGSYLAVGVIGGSVAAASVERSEARLLDTAHVLSSGDELLLANLTREDLIGDLFHGGLLSYFGQYQVLGHLAARTQDSHFQLTNSAGTYGYVPTITYFFGIPRSIMAGGAVMDLDRVAHIASTDGKGQEAWAALNFQLGALASGLEHTVPEQMFVPEGTAGEGVSAVRALNKALAAGQRLYHVTPLNQADVLPKIGQNSLTMNEIRSALAVGREIIVHTDPVTVPGWTGAGYVIFDPRTGAGAWKIGGGANGGFLDLLKAATSLLWRSLVDTALSILELINEATKTLGLAAKMVGYLDMLRDIGASCSDLATFYAVAFYMSALVIISGLLVFSAPGALGFVAATMVSGMSLTVVLSQFKRACSV